MQGRSAVGFDDLIAMDLQYVDGWSLGLDLRVKRIGNVWNLFYSANGTNWSLAAVVLKKLCTVRLT